MTISLRVILSAAKNLHNFIRFVFVGFLMAILAACTTEMPHQTTSATLSTSWNEQGVFAYRDATQGFQAGYILQNNPQNFNAQLFGPLGAWRANLIGDNHSATLSLSDGRVWHSNNPENLMAQNLGWSMPINNLRYWLQGVAAPNSPAKIMRNNNAEIMQLQQSGWIVNFIEYKDFSNHTLPAKLILTQGSKKITIVVNNISFK